MKAVILAAGASSRFWPLNSVHKSLLKIMGKPLIFYTIEGLRRAGIREVVIIEGPNKDIEKGLENYRFSRLKIKYVIQREPEGMGNALWQAKDLLKEQFLVLNAERIDAEEIIKILLIQAYNLKAKSALVGQKTTNPQLYGMAKLKGKRILEIVEKPKKGREPSDIKVVGVYLLEPSFFKIYRKVKKHMYDFEDALSVYMKKNNVKIVILEKSEKDTPSLKYPWHLFEVVRYLFDRGLKSKISESAKIASNATIQGRVYIGKNVRIFENAVIKGPCYIGDNSIVGNNVLLRDYSNIESNSLLGANLEMTRTILEEDVHLHSGFVGDSIFNSGSRVGADVVTSNIRLDRGRIKSEVKGKRIDTGLTSLGAIVGEHTHIGSKVNLMPGVLIGSDCNIGPNAVVMQNIKNRTDFFPRFENIIKTRY